MKMTSKQISEAIRREETRQEKLELNKEVKIILLPADYHIGKFACPCWK